MWVYIQHLCYNRTFKSRKCQQNLQFVTKSDLLTENLHGLGPETTRYDGISSSRSNIFSETLLHGGQCNKNFSWSFFKRQMKDAKWLGLFLFFSIHSYFGWNLWRIKQNHYVLFFLMILTLKSSQLGDGSQLLSNVYNMHGGRQCLLMENTCCEIYAKCNIWKPSNETQAFNLILFLNIVCVI